MFSSLSSFASSSATASIPLQSVSGAYELETEYGTEAAGRLSMILQALETAGFPKAHVNSYSAFDRILSGIAYLLQRIVRREEAEKGRVQWDVLYHPHGNLKSRLGLAQEVVRCVEALDYACPVAIQPHQLLLQDFSDIKIVQKLVLWLIDEGQLASHCEKIRRERAFLQTMGPQKERKHVTGAKTGVERLLDVYAPKRRWQYAAIEGEQEESEDALIQRCLLEYGERVLVVDYGDNEVAMETREEDELPVDLVAQMASQAAAVARSGTNLKPQGKSLSFNRRRLKRSDRRAETFGRRYQAVADQAREEQQTLLRQRREREAKLLQRLVAASDEKERDSTNGRVEASEEARLQMAMEKLKKHEQELIEEKKHLRRKMGTCKSQAAALDEAFLLSSWKWRWWKRKHRRIRLLWRI
uniref:CCDC93 coiled-coil domain-containing protein n=1 Tax=Peronospora matthiolae TaxID=2874970 RepID=A0AAV1TPR4_9STRA